MDSRIYNCRLHLGNTSPSCYHWTLDRRSDPRTISDFTSPPVSFPLPPQSYPRGSQGCRFPHGGGGIGPFPALKLHLQLRGWKACVCLLFLSRAEERDRGRDRGMRPLPPPLTAQFPGEHAALVPRVSPLKQDGNPL